MQLPPEGASLSTKNARRPRAERWCGSSAMHHAMDATYGRGAFRILARASPSFRCARVGPPTASRVPRPASTTFDDSPLPTEIGIVPISLLAISRYPFHVALQLLAGVLALLALASCNRTQTIYFEAQGSPEQNAAAAEAAFAWNRACGELIAVPGKGGVPVRFIDDVENDPRVGDNADRVAAGL